MEHTGTVEIVPDEIQMGVNMDTHNDWHKPALSFTRKFLSEQTGSNQNLLIDVFTWSWLGLYSDRIHINVAIDKSANVRYGFMWPLHEHSISNILFVKLEGRDLTRIMSDDIHTVQQKHLQITLRLVDILETFILLKCTTTGDCCSNLKLTPLI